MCAKIKLHQLLVFMLYIKVFVSMRTARYGQYRSLNPVSSDSGSIPGGNDRNLIVTDLPGDNNRNLIVTDLPVGTLRVQPLPIKGCW